MVSNIDGFIGSESGSTGVVTVTGSGSQWNNSSELVVARTLNVTDGGAVSNTIGYLLGGLALVSGTGSQWNNSESLRVGDQGTGGTLNVADGGEVSNTIGYLGFSSGSRGTATVTGTGSKWTNSSDLSVGYMGNGSGTLNVEAGGVVSNTTGYLDKNNSSTGVATVTGSGSQWNSSSDLYVGNSGTGTLNVEAGGMASNVSGYIGRQYGSTGVATVTGSGSQWYNSRSLYIGERGATGILNIADGGLVTVGKTTKLSSSGTVNLNSGTLSTGTLDVTEAPWQSGVIRFNMTGGFLHATQVIGDINVQGGVVAPGNSPGILTLPTTIHKALLLHWKSN